MTITDEHVAVLRAFLTGDFDEHDRLAEDLRLTPGQGDSPILIGTAFFEAVDRRFTNGYRRADIIRFVADARKRFDQSG